MKATHKLRDLRIRRKTKAKNELSYLSRAVEKNLVEYNVEGRGSTIAIDDLCTDARSPVCSMSGATACFIICNIVSISGWSWICSALWKAACAYTCSYYCIGNPSICATTCVKLCSGICSNQCGRLGPFVYFCEKYACSPACTLVFGPILATFCKK